VFSVFFIIQTVAIPLLFPQRGLFKRKQMIDYSLIFKILLGIFLVMSIFSMFADVDEEDDMMP